MAIHNVFLALLANLAVLTILWTAGCGVFVSLGEDKKAQAFRATIVLLVSTAVCALVVTKTVPFLAEWMEIHKVIRNGRVVGTTIPVWLAFGVPLGVFTLGLSYLDPRNRTTWLGGILLLSALYLGMADFGLHGAYVIPWIFGAVALAARIPFAADWPKKEVIIRVFCKAMVVFSLSYACLLGYGRVRTPAPRWPIENLVAALDDPQTEVRRRAVRMIGGKGSAAAAVLPELDKVLRNDAELRVDAAMAMARIGPESVLLLSHRLHHKKVFVRLAAVKALKALGSRSLPAAQALVSAVSDPDKDVRAEAIRILGILGQEAEEEGLALLELREAFNGDLAEVDWALNRMLGPEPPPPGPYDEIFEADSKRLQAEKESENAAQASGNIEQESANTEQESEQ